ncbi:MAG: hypothetical protein Q7S91_04410, partial [Aquabacterium sp.]|nr:hypothetical protein [Aquabacterium sp.]
TPPTAIAPPVLPPPVVATGLERLPMPAISTAPVVAPVTPAPTAPAALATPAALSPSASPSATVPLAAAGREGAGGAPPGSSTSPGRSAAAGAPDAGARIGHDVATAPSLPASAPRLNLDLVRPRGGMISSQGSRGLLPMVPHPPEAKTKLAEDIQKAAKADCRKAYGAMGLLAVVPLAVDAVRDKGCRW